MKLIMSFVVYVLIGLLLGTGIYSLMHGGYWILIVGGLAYLIAFAKIGCSH